MKSNKTNITMYWAQHHSTGTASQLIDLCIEVTVLGKNHRPKTNSVRAERLLSLHPAVVLNCLYCWLLFNQQ